MRKRILRRVLLLCLLLPVHLLSARADMGPKPSVVVRFQGIEPGTRYYVTLMAQEESTGPHSSVTAFPELPVEAPSVDGDIWKKFVDYQDSDGFHFLQFFQDCTGKTEFQWAYYPPEHFKILVYFPDAEQFVECPEIFQQYAFDSYFDAVYSQNSLRAEEVSLSASDYQEETAGTITARPTYAWAWQMEGFLARLILTIALEVLLAAAFGFSEGKQLMLILLTNFVTQVLLNLALQWMGFQPSFVLYVLKYGLLELGVFLAEAVVYGLLLGRLGGPDRPKGHPVLYAAAANCLSFVVGYLISRMLPQLF